MVGRIIKPHGIRGEVLVEVRTDSPDERFAVGSVLPTDPPEAGPLTVTSARWHTGRLLVCFEQVPDRTAAESLRGLWLTADVDDGPPARDGEYYDHQLTGLTVVTTAGDPVGTVTGVLHHGQDLLVIDPAVSGPAPAHAPAAGPALAPPERRAQRAPDAEVLVPFVAAIVADVDLAAGTLVIDPPPGLLELSSQAPGGPGTQAPGGPGTQAPGGPGTASGAGVPGRGARIRPGRGGRRRRDGAASHTGTPAAGNPGGTGTAGPVDAHAPGGSSVAGGAGGISGSSVAGGAGGG